ncbi:glycosyltransferase family 90 protein, partial [Trematosphaeria pertusa]
GHPIEHLMEDARKRFDAMLKDEAASLEDAAAKYRARRARHPPPGFDAWYTYATESGALVVESFFDQIYHDLAPFWGMDPRSLRQLAHAFSPKISIRGGVVDAEAKNSYERLKQTMNMIQTLAKHPQVRLPDVNVPVNVNEEVGMLVPWETVDTTLSLAGNILASPNDVIDEFSPVDEEEYVDFTFDPEWLDGRLMHPSSNWLGPRPLWSLVQPACPPDSPTRNEPLLEDIWHSEGHTSQEHSAAALLPLGAPTGTLQGYVKNWTTTTDVCLFPLLQALHGGFVAPSTMAVTQKLFPLFSSSKLSTSNEALIPSVGDWNASDYISAPQPWAEKTDKLFWRGAATGGKNTAQNWQRFHRHRFVSMLNATHVEIAEGLLHAGNESMIGLGYARNFRLLPANEYHLATQKCGKMADWVSGLADAAFRDLRCEEWVEGGACPYVEEYFGVKKEVDEDEGQGSCKYAAIIDGDGGDDGGAFLQALRAGKVALKGSVYQQWYDARVVPWLHFVPMDNMFVDLYGIMEYFMGTTNTGDAHDKQAKKIAEGGREWADKVLRKEDMLIYVYRLLLEYARIVDDSRERLGWVDDLVR